MSEKSCLNCANNCLEDGFVMCGIWESVPDRIGVKDFYCSLHKFGLDKPTKAELLGKLKKISTFTLPVDFTLQVDDLKVLCDNMNVLIDLAARE